LDFDGKVSFDAYDKDNIKAKNTAQLLDKVHNGVDLNSIKKTKELRLQIAKKTNALIKLIMAWQNAGLKNNQEEIVRISRQIKSLLSRKSDFTMLLRSLDCVREYIPKDFFD
jgi:hypothetical protein